MRISSGIAEINFNRLNADKIYVWPQYAEGRVENIQRTPRKNESVGAYYKPSPEERNKILDLMNNPLSKEYSPSGILSRTGSGIRPGMLFDAVA